MTMNEEKNYFVLLMSIHLISLCAGWMLSGKLRWGLLNIIIIGYFYVMTWIYPFGSVGYAVSGFVWGLCIKQIDTILRIIL